MLIVADVLVLAVFEPSDASVAVNVALPVVRGVIEKVFVPATSAALAGSVAFESELVIATVSVEETGFQFASTALTVAVNALPAASAVGVPVLPDGVPGAAVSPGRRICSFAKAPALIVVDGLVLAVFVPSELSVAVKVAVPWVFGVTANVFVPATSAALAGSAAFGSELVIAIVSVAVTRFQFASTALTVTVNDEPAVWALGVPVLPEAVPARRSHRGGGSAASRRRPR